ncbi:MAG: sialidase family protein [Eubacteriales bacterium]
MKRCLSCVLCFLLILNMLLFAVACSDKKTTDEHVTTTDTTNLTPDTEKHPDSGVDDYDISEIPNIIWDFSDEDIMRISGVEFSEGVSGEQGSYEFGSYEGISALKLKYSYHSKYSAYRFTVMPISEKNIFTEKHLWVRVTYMTTNNSTAQIVARNVDTGDRITLVNDTVASNGRFVTSRPVSLEKSKILDCLAEGSAINIEFDAVTPSANIYIKEIAFFGTQENAYKHYGDSASDYIEKKAMSFGSAGNAKSYAASSSTTGVYEYDTLKAAISLKYTANPVMPEMGNYLFQPMFNSAGMVSSSYAFVRVLYSANNPIGTDSVSLSIRSDSNSNLYVNWDGIKNTEGFVLSDVRMMPTDLIQRIAEGKQVSLIFNADKGGGEYCVKAIYFFKSKADAALFEVKDDTSKVFVEGADMSEYSIILPYNAVKREYDAAKSLQSIIYQVTGDLLPIAIDTESSEGKYEILIGKTNRKASQTAYRVYESADCDIGAYSLSLSEKKLVFAAFYNPGLEDLISQFKDTYFAYSDTQKPKEIYIDNVSIKGTRSGSGFLEKYTKWSDVENVSEPKCFTDDFSGENMWNEEGNDSNWTVKNGSMISSGSGYELSYLQIYEKNAVFSADLAPAPTKSGKGTFGLQLRYTSRYGYVRGGYDYATGEWFIESREGEDFTPVRSAVKSGAPVTGTEFRMTLTVNNGTATLSVNGNTLLTAVVSHVSPGRIAVFDEDVAVRLDNVVLELSSGMGKSVIANVTHTVIPEEAYLEGGTVIELGDGYLHYVHHSGTAYVSEDGGKTWDTEAPWYKSVYPSIITLRNGELLRVTAQAVGSVSSVVMQASSDGGKTWENVGTVCSRLYPGTTSFWANNMNDKMTQISTGRIFYVQSYENTKGDTSLGSRNTFCVVYYSDDNGRTWNKSSTSTLDLTDMSYFSEAKVLECADGSLRLMSSWNNYPTIMYSESTDGGITWGALTALDGFDSSCASMAFMRDPNGKTDYCYYMVWCNDEFAVKNPSGTTAITMPRSRLTLAYTEDGKNWIMLGDIWRWESNYTYRYGMLNHIVDPFIYITEDSVIIGSGISEKWKVTGEGYSNVHQAQRQHIWQIPKSSLNPTEILFFE